MLNIAIVGCGKVTEHHIKITKKLKNIKVVGLCDLNYGKAKSYGDKYNIKAFKDYDSMIKGIKKIDIVAIITPSGMHFNHAIDILKKYKKNLIIEKPFLLKPSEVKKLYNISKKLECKIFPVFQNRYNKAVERVHRAIKNGELGKIRISNIRLRWCRPDRYYKQSKWRGTFSLDGGVLSNQGIHHLDLLRYLTGDIKKIYVLMKTFGSKIEVEDTVVATVEYESGAVGTLEVTTAARPDDFEASLSIVGSKGLAQIGGVAVNELQTFSPKKKDCKIYSEKIPNAYGFGHIQIYKNIIKSFEKKGFKYPISESESYKTTKLLNAFYRADELKKPVNINKIKESKRLGRKNIKLTKLYSK